MEIIESVTFLGVWQIILVLVTVILLTFPVLALISILKNDFMGNDKIVWVLVALFLPFFGSLFYNWQTKTLKKIVHFRFRGKH